jgi:SAM-dependent methyltransferase
MNWDIPYTVSRALMLQISDRGELLAGSTISRTPQALAADGLPVLLAFAGGRTPAEALARLRNDWEIDEAGFRGVVDTLVSQNMLTPAKGDSAVLAAGGFASPVAHFGMVRDTVRVQAYRRAIFRHCRDKNVVEIGCGSGILSIFAAKAGARRVIAIEESGIADLAAAMFEANGVADRIELRRANSRDVSVDEPADVLIQEIIGNDPLNENVLPSIEDARERLLAPNGMLIPSAMEICCVGFEVADTPYNDRARACRELTELEGIYGLDFTAFRQLFDAAPSDPFIRPLGNLGQAQFSPRILTAETEICRIDFARDTPLTVTPRSDLRLRATHAGSLGGILIYFRAHLDEETVLSNSPYSPRTSWDRNARALDRLLAVTPGQEIPIIAERRSVAGTDMLYVGLG